MANLFLGFPVPRAKIASMIEGTAPPSNHHTQHESGGSDEIDCTGLGGAGGATLPFTDFWLDDHWADGGNWITSLYGTATVSRALNQIKMSSGTTNHSIAILEHEIDRPITQLTWNKERQLTIRIKPTIPTLSACEIRIITGKGGSNNHMGFEWRAGKLKGMWSDGSTWYDIDLKSYSVPSDYTETLLHLKYYPGSKIEWWVDGVKEGETTQHLPSGLYYAKYLWFIQAQNTSAAVDCKAEFNHVQFYQAS